jgi:hypothetical protein
VTPNAHGVQNLGRAVLRLGHEPDRGWDICGDQGCCKLERIRVRMPAQKSGAVGDEIFVTDPVGDVRGEVRDWKAVLP